MRPMPNALRVLIHLPHPVKWDAMRPPLRIRELKHFRALGREADLVKRNQNYPVLSPVVITQLKAPAAEFGIPPDAVQQLVNGNHLNEAYTRGFKCGQFAGGSSDFRVGA